MSLCSQIRLHIPIRVKETEKLLKVTIQFSNYNEFKIYDHCKLLTRYFRIY